MFPDAAGKYRYLSLAQDLVMSARGKLKDRNWKRANGSPATIDDISVFVIPILPYKEEYKRMQVYCISGCLPVFWI
jgi:protein phosphatase 1H